MKLANLQYGRAIRAKGHDLGLSFAVLDPLIKGWKIVLHPWAYVERKRAMRELLPLSMDNPFRLNEEKGYSLFERGRVKGIDAVVDECEGIFAERTRGIDLSNPKNRFRHSLLDADNLADQKATLGLAMRRDLVGAAAAYLGTVPTLGAVQLWWTPQNDLLEGSQYYHIDQVDRRQFKLFLNIRPVSTDGGALTFLPAPASRAVFQGSPRRYDRIEDSEAYTYCSADDAVQITGDAGDGGVVDSSRCYHFGGRARARERLVLMIQYFPYHCVKETSDQAWSRAAARLAESYGRTGTYRDQLLQLPPNSLVA